MVAQHPGLDVVSRPIAEKVGLADGLRDATENGVKLFERRVRWTQQTAKLKGFLESGGWSKWILTGKAHRQLNRPGIVFALYETDRSILLWANAQDAPSISRIPYLLIQSNNVRYRAGDNIIST